MQTGSLDVAQAPDFGQKDKKRETSAPVVGSSSATASRSQSAASLALSAEAQRLALIPAQVIDPEELAAAREKVDQAAEELAQVHAHQHQDEQLAPPSQQKRNAHDSATLIHGRSPFESSAPGSTGQSLDIVVGS